MIQSYVSKVHVHWNLYTTGSTAVKKNNNNHNNNYTQWLLHEFHTRTESLSSVLYEQPKTNKKTLNKTSKDRKTHLYSAHSSSCRLFPKLKVRQIQHRDQIQMKVELQKLSSTGDSTTKEVLERYKKKNPHTNTTTDTTSILQQVKGHDTLKQNHTLRQRWNKKDTRNMINLQRPINAAYLITV